MKKLNLTKETLVSLSKEEIELAGGRPVSYWSNCANTYCWTDQASCYRYQTRCVDPL